MIPDQRLEELPTLVWRKIAQTDELKGQWIGGVKLGPGVWNPKGYRMLQSDVMRAARRLEENNIANLMNSSNGCRSAGDVYMVIFTCLQRKAKKSGWV